MGSPLEALHGTWKILRHSLQSRIVVKKKRPCFEKGSGNWSQILASIPLLGRPFEDRDHRAEGQLPTLVRFGIPIRDPLTFHNQASLLPPPKLVFRS